MFLGHFAVGFAAKRVAPRASLGTLFAAAQLLDLLWPPLVLAGIETVQVAPGDTAYTPLRFTSYPWSHSLLLALAWSAIFAVAYRARTGHSREAWVVGALVAYSEGVSTSYNFYKISDLLFAFKVFGKTNEKGE